jgi:hypothetical protein
MTSFTLTCEPSVMPTHESRPSTLLETLALVRATT